MSPADWFGLALGLAKDLGKAVGDVWASIVAQRPELRDVDMRSVEADYTKARDKALGGE